jgi:hypothetical protein
MRFLQEHVKTVKVINIFEENAVAIEKMANNAIEEIDRQGLKILDIKITEDNMFFILGDK